MSRNLKIVGSVLLLALIASVLAGCTGTAVGQDVDVEGAERTIHVAGDGQASGTPDMATVVIGVETQANEASAALTQNSQQMQDVIDALTEAGVAQEDIQTQTVQLRPVYEQQPRPEAEGAPELVGYVATNTVQVDVMDLDGLGDLLDAAVSAGGNRIEAIRFDIQDPSTLLEEARQAAWQDALAKAQQLAELADAELGPVFTINESSSRPIPVVRESVMGAGEQARVPIEPGTQDITVHLEVTWLLR